MWHIKTNVLIQKKKKKETILNVSNMVHTCHYTFAQTHRICNIKTEI